MKTSTRRTFVSSVALLAPGVALFGQTQQDKPMPLEPTVVSEFVRVAHNNLDRVKELLAEHPTLLNAAWDWGKGDFETALGAAGHMGLRETALFLIEKGARTDIFSLTMLGKTAIVKSTLEAYPNLLESIGPHGFTLLHHAKQGGAEAAELFDYLQSKGLTDLHRKVFK